MKQMRDEARIRDDIVKQLATVIDPELGIDIVNLGLVYRIDLDEEGICLVEMTLTTMGCPLTDVLAKLVTTAVKRVPEVKNVDVEFIWEPAWTTDRLSRTAKLALGIH
jgi:metal-sulfur cluster biosynthetic enzyme